MKNNFMNEKKKIFISIGVLIFGIVGVIVLLSWNANNKYKETAQTDLKQSQEYDISYNGKKYRQNEHIRTYLYMGIDKDGPVVQSEDSVSGGQSDAMFLIIVDSEHKTISILAINRNTMADVDVYDKEGSLIGTEKMQICLQHGFGDGMRTSCQRSVDAVSNLLYGQRIDGYLAMNMDALTILNDSVGGVTVEIMDDLTSPSRNVALQKGTTVTLNGDEAYVYLRSRDISEFDSATERLNRQMQYIQAFVQQIKTNSSNGAEQLISAYNSITDYVVTNIDVPKLADKLFSYEFDSSKMYTIAGETQMGEEYEEYIVDEDALYQQVLDIFYQPVE